MKLKVYIESEEDKYCAYLSPEYDYLGFYGEGYTPEEAEEDFMLSYEEYKTEEISEGKDPKEYSFNFLICE